MPMMEKYGVDKPEAGRCKDCGKTLAANEQKVCQECKNQHESQKTN